MIAVAVCPPNRDPIRSGYRSRTSADSEQSAHFLRQRRVHVRSMHDTNSVHSDSVSGRPFDIRIETAKLLIKSISIAAASGGAIYRALTRLACVLVAHHERCFPGSQSRLTCFSFRIACFYRNAADLPPRLPNAPSSGDVLRGGRALKSPKRGQILIFDGYTFSHRCHGRCKTLRHRERLCS